MFITKMPKRSCPFESNLLPQMKIRLDEKEYDKKHENLSKVHEKTLELLYNGAKKLYYERNKNSKECNARNYNNEKIQNAEFCAVCNELNVIENKCTFCEKWACLNCSAFCSNCLLPFCASHFIKQYGPKDDCICLSC